MSVYIEHMNNAATTTAQLPSQETVTAIVIDKAAEVAAHFARIAMKHGAPEAAAIRIGIDVVCLGMTDTTATCSALNGVAAGRGRMAARA